MVEGVRASGIGAAEKLPRDGTKTRPGSFTVDDGTAPPAQKARLASLAGIGLESMLALQAVDEAAERDRSAHKHGTAMLAALTRLQQAMLAEEDPTSALNALHELSGDGPPANDPELGAIVRMVALRCRVEFARRAHVALRQHAG